VFSTFSLAVAVIYFHKVITATAREEKYTTLRETTATEIKIIKII
jgi:hypothetical protein